MSWLSAAPSSSDALIKAVQELPAQVKDLKAQLASATNAMG